MKNGLLIVCAILSGVADAKKNPSFLAIIDRNNQAIASLKLMTEREKGINDLLNGTRVTKSAK